MLISPGKGFYKKKKCNNTILWCNTKIKFTEQRAVIFNVYVNNESFKNKIKYQLNREAVEDKEKEER